jgi:hypothetical protein
MLGINTDHSAQLLLIKGLFLFQVTELEVEFIWQDEPFLIFIIY